MICRWTVILVCLTMIHYNPTQAETSQKVNDCVSFLKALRSDDIELIVITDSIYCTSEDFSQTTRLQRNVQIIGENNRVDESKPVLNLTDLVYRVLEINKDQLILISNIDIVKANGLETIVIPEIYLNEGARLMLNDVSILYSNCEQTTYSWSSNLASIHPPENFPNSQEVEIINERTIFIRSLAMESSEWSGKTYRFVCNSLYKCDSNTTTSQLTSLWRDAAQNVSVDCSNALEAASNKRNKFRLLNSLSFTESLLLTIAIGVLLLSLIVLSIFLLRKYLISRRHKSNQNLVCEERESELQTAEAIDTNEVEIEMQRRLQDQDLLDLEIESLLGKGAFGSVYRCRWRGTLIALKIIDHSEELVQAGNTSLEALVSKNIAHPNMVQTFLVKTLPYGQLFVKGLESSISASPVEGSESEDEFKTMVHSPLSAATHQTFILMEYCNRESLDKEIQKGSLKKGVHGMQFLILTALDIAHAISYLHSLGVTHGDLKAANVLLKTDTTDPRGFICKISDFGLCKLQSSRGYDTAFKHGTVTHMSPEMLTEGKLSHAVDVYSFGMLLWEMIAVEDPFPHKTQSEIMLAIANGHRPRIPHNCPPGYANLISCCWRHNYEQRPSLSEIVSRLQRIHQALLRLR